MKDVNVAYVIDDSKMIIVTGHRAAADEVEFLRTIRLRYSAFFLPHV
jgi:hypothetical protein